MILQGGTNSLLKGCVPAEGRAEAYGGAIERNKTKIKTRCAENWRAFDSPTSSTHLSLRTVPFRFAHSRGGERRPTSTADLTCSRSGRPSLVFCRFGLLAFVLLLMNATSQRNELGM